MNNNLFFAIIFLIGICTSCKNKTVEVEKTEGKNSSEVLIDYLESNDNYINSSGIPSMIDATKIYENLENNFLIIDIRNNEDYNYGHIKNAHNVLPDSILYFFENIIEPNSFDSIVLVCDIGARSAYITGLLRLLGYNNVFSMRFGMASWHTAYAENTWLKARSSEYTNKLDTLTYHKPEKTNLPKFDLGEQTPYKMLRERVDVLLKEDIRNVSVDFNDYTKQPNGHFFIVSYWPLDLYLKGHLPNAVQYTPKKSLHSQEDLFTLPTASPILIYCYTGQHSSFVAAFLRVLGYEAYSLKYGANAFIYDTMKNTQRASRVFSEKHIHNFPLEKTDIVQEPVINMPISIPVKGGC